MKRTPDATTAKRGRSEETQTPVNRQRISSPEQNMVTPGRSYSTGGTGRSESAKSMRNSTMEADSQKRNTSNRYRRCQEGGVGDGVGDFIDDKPYKSTNKKNADQMGVSGILGIEQPTHQHLPYLIKTMGEIFKKELSKAIEPLKDEIRKLTNKIETMETKACMKTSDNPPTWPQVRSNPIIPIIPHIPKVTEREQAFNLARRCVGLFPISQEDLIRNTELIQDCPDQNN